MAASAAAKKGHVALQDVRIERVLDAEVEIVEAVPEDRFFPDRVNESLGLCLKIGGSHEVVADGRRLVYPKDAVCVRPPGCVWSTASTGRVGFLSIDIEPGLLPPDGLVGSMQFIKPEALPDLRWAAASLRSHSRLLQETIVAELVDSLVRTGLLRSRELRDASSAAAIERMRALLEERVSQPPDLRELAALVGGNRFVLLRQFRRRYGMPPHAFVLRLRVERARALLARGRDIAEVAQLLGFADQSHLNRAFKRLLGLPPNAYRRRLYAPSR